MGRLLALVVQHQEVLEGSHQEDFQGARRLDSEDEGVRQQASVVLRLVLEVALLLDSSHRKAFKEDLQEVGEAFHHLGLVVDRSSMRS